MYPDQTRNAGFQHPASDLGLLQQWVELIENHQLYSIAREGMLTFLPLICPSPPPKCPGTRPCGHMARTIYPPFQACPRTLVHRPQLLSSSENFHHSKEYISSLSFLPPSFLFLSTGVSWGLNPTLGDLVLLFPCNKSTNPFQGQPSPMGTSIKAIGSGM